VTVALRKKKLNGGRISLYLDIYSEGTRRYEFLKLYLGGDRGNNRETLELAKTIRAKRELEVQSDSHGVVPRFKKRANFVTYFEQQVKSKNPGNTAWRNTLVHLKRFAPDGLRFIDLTSSWLESYRSYLLARVSPSTARTYFGTIRTAIRKGIRDGFLTINPADSVTHIRASETDRVFLTLSELRAFSSSTCDYPELKRAFLFACYSGLRLSDVRALKWGQVQNNRLHFRQKKTGGREYLPLSEQAIQLLGPAKDLPSVVFNLPSLATIEKHLRLMAEEACISKHITFHCSRHTFATLALTHDVDIYTVSKLLGHRELKTTQIYAQIIDKKKEEAVSRIPSLEL